ncbi:arrestin [Hirsutella rhossiliensis]|uniref:Arrestin n=1 Tax=Hirsutella rhossiliensis TaxID=111463 RepID=A0A9P8N0B8_9HYPO|nr:arrestin [Hirsutella rhossiliensis]KAH0964555.1 arrestin [Hirsutella rhossiliensis]
MVSQHTAEAVIPRVGARSKPAAQQKPTIDIHIDRHFNSKVYTSGATISGRAVVCPQRDTPFDDFDIIFTGIAATRLDFVQQYPSHSFRPFMKLRMPIPPSALPESNVFEAGKTYMIPFNFVVPHQLTLGACTHHCISPAVREQHLRMPPTVGFWEADDQAPEMAQIEYSVKARAYRKTGAANAPTKFMEGYHMVKVLPALPEDAPLDITFRDERYSLSKSKTIRKNLFSAKAGKLTATASQPDAVMLSADGHGASTATARVTLEFAPSSVDNPPPKITSVSGKLTSATFFGAAPTDLLPNLGSRSVYTANPSLSYTTTSVLFSQSIGKMAWQQRNTFGRRDSGYSSLGVEEEASETDCDGRGRAGGKSKGSKKCPIQHTALLEIPFSIPKTNRKLFLPTFHSCLISRTYTLYLNLSVGPGNTAITLAVPLQIGVETIHQPQFNGGLPSFESATAEDEEAEIDAHLQPRLLRIPDRPEQNNAMLPGYEEFSRRAIAVT